MLSATLLSDMTYISPYDNLLCCCVGPLVPVPCGSCVGCLSILLCWSLGRLPISLLGWISNLISWSYWRKVCSFRCLWIPSWRGGHLAHILLRESCFLLISCRELIERRFLWVSIVIPCEWFLSVFHPYLCMGWLWLGQLLRSQLGNGDRLVGGLLQWVEGQLMVPRTGVLPTFYLRTIVRNTKFGST